MLIGMINTNLKRWIKANQKLSKNFPDREKCAYLGEIDSLATADHWASEEEELEHIKLLANSAGLSDSQKESVIKAATELSGD